MSQLNTIQIGQTVQPNVAGASQLAAAPATGLVATDGRIYIWQGLIEWTEKGKSPNDQKITRQVSCQVSVNSHDRECELKADSWPQKLIMQLIPKQVIGNIGEHYLKDSKSVLFHLHQNEALDSLTKVMVRGFAGCTHFFPLSPASCNIRVLILLYIPEKKAFLGFIPNNQAAFMERLKKVIQEQISYIISKQEQGAITPGAPALQETLASQPQTSHPVGDTLCKQSQFVAELP